MATIIFDFDGTIADSFDYVSGFLASQKGISSLSDDQKAELKGLSMTAMVKKLGYHWWNAPRLFFNGRSQMANAIDKLNPFEGMPEVIRKLHAEGHELFILSTNSSANINKFLHRQNMHTYFIEVYGGVGLFGKAPSLRRLLKEQKIDIKDAFYVGDELRDIQASQSIGLKIIAVSWGFASLQTLRDHKPTALADQPEDIITILEEL